MSNSSFVRTSYGRPSDLVLVTKKMDLINPLLGQLLSLCTPNGTEHHIVEVIRSQPFIRAHKRFLDKKLGNYVVQVGESRSIFSCHMDIVGNNHKDILGMNKVEKIFFFTPEENIKNSTQYGVIWGAKANINTEGKVISYTPSTLGADDKVGVYILLRMIEANIPGIYIFHTGEECGGLGSAFLATNFKNLFENKDRAIAFDRAGYSDVIGFQRGGRCCSTEFGAALAAQLNDNMPPKVRFKEDAHGTFTDTANYIQLVPECTNVSVGYFNQHGSGEHLDVYWLDTWLLPAILKCKFEELPVKRNPKEVPKSYSNWQSWKSDDTNKPKVAWKDATTKTPYLEFPKWSPELGVPEGASEEVLVMAIGRYLATLNWGKERDAFCAWLVSQLNNTQSLTEENKALQAALDFANGPTKANPPDVILLPPPANYKKEVINIKLEKQEDGSVKMTSTSNKPTPLFNWDFEEKVSLLTRLVVVAEKVILPDKDDEKWLRNYAVGAKKILDKLGDKTSFSEKETAKVNRIIFAMGNLIDNAAVLSADEEKLLMNVEKHICETYKEPGWFQPIKKENVTTIH